MNANNQKILSKVYKKYRAENSCSECADEYSGTGDDKCKLDITCNEEDGDEEIEYCGICEEIFHSI